MAHPWTPHDMDPSFAAAIAQHTGMPTMGRRYMGYGASPFGPGAQIPVHAMNYLNRGMGHAGVADSWFAAGQYPRPRLPFPLGGGGGGGPQQGMQG